MSTSKRIYISKYMTLFLYFENCSLLQIEKANLRTLNQLSWRGGAVKLYTTNANTALRQGLSLLMLLRRMTVVRFEKGIFADYSRFAFSLCSSKRRSFVTVCVV